MTPGWGFLAFTLPHVEVIMPSMRIEPVNSRVKRCRMGHDVLRLCMQGIRDLLMEVCGARHNFRVRLTLWQVILY